jgi:hypothetical protein
MVPNVSNLVEIHILCEIVIQNLQAEETAWKVKRCKINRKGNEWKKKRRMLKSQR